MGTPTLVQRTKRKIDELLEGLPLQSLVVVEQFVRFLREQAQRGQPVVTASGEKLASFRYPTVPVPPSVLDGLVGLMPPVEGDALADTEALYDKV
jgi:hypothetical protein